MEKVIKHYAVFLSPGIIFSENTEKEISSWDIELAKKMARDIKDKNNNIPYGFYFISVDADGMFVEQSNLYYLGGKVYTLTELKAENNPDYEIAINNMEKNGYEKIIINNDACKWIQPLKEGEVVLDFIP